MDESVLRTYVERARAVVETDPPSTVAETRRWLVEPLLAALGWEVRSSSCETDVQIAGTRLEYVLSVDETPALLVAVTGFGDRSPDRDERDLRAAMAATGVDRAILTDGRTVAVLAGTESADRFVCSLDELSDHAEVVSHVSRSGLAERLADRTRRRAARRIAVRRAELARRIADELAAVADAGDAGEFEAAADAFLADLVDASLEAAGADGRERDPPASGRADGESAPAEGPADESPTDGATDAGTTDPRSGVGPTDEEPEQAAGPDRTSTKAAREDPATPDDERTGDGEGEYVVRFFGDAGSIGAVGHSESAAALAAAAEFLLERGLSGIRVPWRPEGSARTVLNDRPVTDDGTPMTAYRQLSNGYALNTAGTVADHAKRVEALADRAGFRAMLTGDWDADRS